PTGGQRRVYALGSPLDPVAGVGLTGTQYVAELYVGADASSLTPVTASISRFRSTTTINPGWWANTGIYGPNDVTILPGFAHPDIVTLQVRAWDFSQFATYEAAVGQDVTGASVPFTYKIPFQGPGNAEFMEGLQAFALVPEPPIVALGLVGVASMILLRRS